MGGAAQEGVVVGRQEGVELPEAGVAVGEVLEVTVDVGALEALVAVVAVVVVAEDSVAEEDSEEVVVVSEAHKIQARRISCASQLFSRGARVVRATADCSKGKKKSEASL